MKFPGLVLLALLTVAAVLPCGARTARLDSLLGVLSQEVERRPVYARATVRAIDSLRALRLRAPAQSRWEWDKKIFDQYKAFSVDTALMVARQAELDARAVGSDSLVWLSRLMQSQAMKGIGRYYQALSIIKELPPQAARMHRHKMLTRLCSTYTGLYQSSTSREDSAMYRKLAVAYRDSITALFGLGSIDGLVSRAERELLLGRPASALAALDSLEGERGSGAVPLYVRARALAALGRDDEAMELLAQASINDLRGSNKRYEALQMLAQMLNDHGDQHDAYKFIMCAVDDLMEGNSRSGMLSVTKALPIIVSSYESERASSRRRLWWMLGGMFALAAALAVSVVRLYRSRRDVAADRAQLARQNAELSRLRDELAQSVKAREGYIGLLFTVWADYIDTSEHLRTALLRKIKAGHLAEAEASLSASLAPAQQRDFLNRFDTMFLQLYPDFVERFNSLLLPDQQVAPRKGELLSPELRIYALVRLGITDSPRIAQFLRYSPQTVYNYRLRMRNRAAVPREEFAARVQQL